jgi:hypothetical protein
MGTFAAGFTGNIIVSKNAFATKRRIFPEFDFGKSMCESGNA